MPPPEFMRVQRGDRRVPAALLNAHSEAVEGLEGFYAPGGGFHHGTLVLPITPPEMFLAQITAKEQDSDPPVYSWRRWQWPADDGTKTYEPDLIEGGPASDHGQFPAYEDSDNPDVPTDGSAIVELWPSRGGVCLHFHWQPLRGTHSFPLTFTAGLVLQPAENTTQALTINPPAGTTAAALVLSKPGSPGTSVYKVQSTTTEIVRTITGPGGGGGSNVKTVNETQTNSLWTGPGSDPATHQIQVTNPNTTTTSTAGGTTPPTLVHALTPTTLTTTATGPGSNPPTNIQTITNTLWTGTWTGPGTNPPQKETTLSNTLWQDTWTGPGTNPPDRVFSLQEGSIQDTMTGPDANPGKIDEGIDEDGVFLNLEAPLSGQAHNLFQIATNAGTPQVYVDPDYTLFTAPSTTAAPGLVLPEGVAPTSPPDGSLWYDGTDIQGQADGATYNLTHPAAGNGRNWVKVTKDYTDFTDTDTTNDIPIHSVPAGSILHQTLIKHSTAFSGGSVTSVTISLGVAGNLTKYQSAFNVNQTVADTAQLFSTTNQPDRTASAAIDVRAQMITSLGNIDDLTQGEVDIWLEISDPG